MCNTITNRSLLYQSLFPSLAAAAPASPPSGSAAAPSPASAPPAGAAASASLSLGLGKWLEQIRPNSSCLLHLSIVWSLQFRIRFWHIFFDIGLEPRIHGHARRLVEKIAFLQAFQESGQSFRSDANHSMYLCIMCVYSMPGVLFECVCTQANARVPKCLSGATKRLIDVYVCNLFSHQSDQGELNMLTKNAINFMKYTPKYKNIPWVCRLMLKLHKYLFFYFS